MIARGSRLIGRLNPVLSRKVSKSGWEEVDRFIEAKSNSIHEKFVLKRDSKSGRNCTHWFSEAPSKRKVSKVGWKVICF